MTQQYFNLRNMYWTYEEKIEFIEKVNNFMFMSNLEKATLFSFLRYKALNKGIILRRCTEWSVHNFKGRFFGFFLYVIKLCFICRPSDFTVSEDAPWDQRSNPQDFWDFSIKKEF